MKIPLSSGLAGRAKGLWAPGRILEGAWSWWGELWTTLAGLAPPEFRICAVEYSVVRSKCRALFKMLFPHSQLGRPKPLALSDSGLGVRVSIPIALPPPGMRNEAPLPT